MLTDHGYTPIFASWIIGVLGASSIVFTLGLGALADRYGARPVLGTIYAGRAAVFACLFLIRDTPFAILAVAAVGGITMAGLHVHDVHARGRHLRPLLGGLDPRRDLPRAPDRRGAGLLARGRALRIDRRLRGAMYALACAFLLIAGVVSLRVDSGTRAVRWVPRRAGA